MIQKGSYAVYHGATINDIKYNFNMYNRKGIAEMYITKYTTFPNCIYSLNEIKMMEKPKRINKMTILEQRIDRPIGALDPVKYVMVIYCKDDGNENKEYCEVDTSINNIGSIINLVENEEFSKYALKGDKGSFKIDLKRIEIKSLTIDIMIYNGDVDFKVRDFEDNEKTEINYNKYTLSNKIFYHFDFDNMFYDIIEIEYYSKYNSFFTIKYGMNSFNLIQLYEKVSSDESYLVEIDSSSEERYKNIYLQNYRTKKQQPFLVNFISFNCQFKVSRDDNEIVFFNDYAQEILYKETKGYNSEYYEYKIEISEKELSINDNKMCMIYVTGYESNDYDYETEILVPDSLKQKINFSNDPAKNYFHKKYLLLIH